METREPPARAKLPDPDPPNLLDYEWKVLTPETLPEGDGWVFFALTPGDFQKAALNDAEKLRWALEVMWRLRYYKGEADE